MRGENESLIVEREEPWKRLWEKGFEVANKVGEAEFVFLCCLKLYLISSLYFVDWCMRF